MKQNKTNQTTYTIHYLKFYLSFYFIDLLFVLMLFLDATKIEQ